MGNDQFGFLPDENGFARWRCAKCGEVIRNISHHWITLDIIAHMRAHKDDGNQSDLAGKVALSPPTLRDSFQRDRRLVSQWTPETFYTIPPLTVFKEVKNSPIIPKDALPKSSTILKASKLNLPVGTRKHFLVISPTITNEGLYSMQVKDGVTEGAFPLNKTNLEVMCAAAGVDSDAWVGFEFDALVVPTKNAKDQTPTLGWYIVRDSVKKTTPA
jgi:hypothetical protein